MLGLLIHAAESLFGQVIVLVEFLIHDVLVAKSQKNLLGLFLILLKLLEPLFSFFFLVGGSCALFGGFLFFFHLATSYSIFPS